MRFAQVKQRQFPPRSGHTATRRRQFGDATAPSHRRGSARMV